MKKNQIILKALDGEFLSLNNVETFYKIGNNIVVVVFLDGKERYFTNFKVWDFKGNK